MKRLWSLLLVVLMLCALLPASVVAEPVHVEFWSLFGGNDGAYMEAQVAAFNASQDKYVIDLVSTGGGSDHYIKLKTSVIGGEAPDLCISHDDYVWGLVKEGILTPIDKACEESGVTIEFDNYIEKLNMLKYEGTVYAVPLDGVIRIMNYNKDVCRECGLLNDDGTLNIGDGLDAWVEAFEKVKAAGYYPFVTGVTGTYIVHMFNTLYYQFGGTQPWISDDGTTVTIEKEPCIEAMKAYQTLISYCPEGISSVSEFFLEGKTAFCYDQSASGKTYFTGLGDAYGAQSAPKWGSSRKVAVFSHTFVLPVSEKRTPEQTAGACEFIKWFGINNMGWAACGHMPAYKPVLDSEEFKASQLHPYYADSVLMPTDSLSYGAPVAMKGSSEMNDPLQALGAGEITPEEAYEQVYENLTNLVNDYQ